MQSLVDGYIEIHHEGLGGAATREGRVARMDEESFDPSAATSHPLRKPSAPEVRWLAPRLLLACGAYVLFCPCCGLPTSCAPPPRVLAHDDEPEQGWGNKPAPAPARPPVEVVELGNLDQVVPQATGPASGQLQRARTGVIFNVVASFG